MRIFGSTNNPSYDKGSQNGIKLNDFCNGCPFVELRSLNKKNQFYNWFCTHDKIEDDDVKLIDFKVRPGTFVPRPSFCKKNEKKEI